MTWELTADRPIYAQLAERLQLQIIQGEYGPGGKLPGVRELASAAAVNPNAVQKALGELERSGLIVSGGSGGRTVTEDAGLIQDMRKKLAEGHVDAFLARMGELGYARAEIIALLEERKGDGWII